MNSNKSSVFDVPPGKYVWTFLLLGLTSASTLPIVRAHDITDMGVITHPAEHGNSVTEGSIYSGSEIPVTSTAETSLILDDDTEQAINPPYSGTVFLDADIITPDDPTSFIDLEINAESAEEESFHYTAIFSDTANVELLTYGFSDEPSARDVALKVAKAVGSIPASMKPGLKQINIHFGDGRANANASLGLINLQSLSSSFINYLEELLAHEAAHISLDNRYRASSDWQYAQTIDPTFISNYAQSRSGTEDIAESVVPYLAYRYRPQRISKADYASILKAMPARIAFFDRELGNLAPVTDESEQLVSRFTNINNGDSVSIGDFLEWSIPDGADRFDVVLGSTGYGSNDIRQSNTIAENRLQLTALPDGIDNVYAKLWSRVDGQWRAVHYRFKTDNATRIRASIYSPIPGDKIAGDTIVFRWYNPPGTTQVDLLAGTQGPGSTDLRQSQPLTTRSSITLNNVPLQPSILYVRVLTYNGSWQYEDFEFEANQRAELLSPVVQNRLSGSEVEFVWDSPPGVRSIDILAGTTGPGSTDIRASNVVSSDQGQLLVENLPATGQTLYVRFWSLTIDGWKLQDIEYMLPFPQMDRDGDGVEDDIDAYPDDANETADTDGDGVGDNADAFPADASEAVDTDGDGIGDNADAFPADASETADSDGDGIGDNAEALVVDANETADSNGDGIKDNSEALVIDIGETADSKGDEMIDNAAALPANANETVDSDNDEVEDNADALVVDANGTVDSIGDGTVDNAAALPANETDDSDGNGIEENADGLVVAEITEQTATDFDVDGVESIDQGPTQPITIGTGRVDPMFLFLLILIGSAAKRARRNK